MGRGGGVDVSRRMDGFGLTNLSCTAFISIRESLPGQRHRGLKACNMTACELGWCH